MKKSRINLTYFSGTLLGGVILLITACSPGGIRGPEVKDYLAPNLTVNTGVFQDDGCPPDEHNQRACPPDSPLGALGCDRISDPGNLLGGLLPAYPINVCVTFGPPENEPLDDDEYLYNDGCLEPQYVRLVIWRENQYQLIKSQAELAQTYAPIESEDEALSYALAATRYGAKYGLEHEPGYRYLADKLEDTYVSTTDEGFRVHLFYYQVCGCGPHTTSAVDLLVKSDGQIEELGWEKMYEDPEEDDLCID